MSSAMMMERPGMGMPGMGMPGMGTPPGTAPAGMPGGGNWMMVPRGTCKVEKCAGGFKMTCACDDKLACSMVQNLCTMLAGGMVSCCVLMNGLPVCYYNLTMGLCKYELTEEGVGVSCTSGDTACAAMLQACGDCMAAMLAAGCTCCLMMNYTPVCCGMDAAKAVKPAKTAR